MVNCVVVIGKIESYLNKYKKEFNLILKPILLKKVLIF